MDFLHDKMGKKDLAINLKSITNIVVDANKSARLLND